MKKINLRGFFNVVYILPLSFLIITILAIALFWGCGSEGGETADSNYEPLGADLATVVQPSLYDEFKSLNTTVWRKQRVSPGSITFGATTTSAQDGVAVNLVLRGNSTLGVYDYASPEFANQISTKNLFSFGTYRVRAKAAACSRLDEEVITAPIFVYSYNDGAVNNNNEIDIEIACSDTSILFFTIWTKYIDDENFSMTSRMVDMDSGDVWQTAGGWGYDKYLGKPIAGLPIQGFSAKSQFYEMGFDWYPDHVRYFIVVNGQEITLWNFTDPLLIPQAKAYAMSNIWHSEGIWTGDGGAARYPRKNATSQIDWFKYWAK